MAVTTSVFADDFATARAKFLASCTLLGLQPETHVHPLAGAAGETLATDVVRIGPAHARNLLVLTSGVHGVELFAGAGCQLSWLLSNAPLQLPPDTAVLIVHAINPWGTSWLRRYTEDNVDLCRNYVDFSAPLPRNEAYDGLHEAVVVDLHDAAAVASGEARIAAFGAAHGSDKLYSALMAGQHAFPEGMGFGGSGPTWSRRTMESILRAHASRARRVCLVDYHTGLGPYGHGSIVALQTGEPLARVRRAFGEWVMAVCGDDAPPNFAPVSGHTTPGYERALPEAEVTAVVLEYGTGSPQQMLEILLRDQRELQGTWQNDGAGAAALSANRRALLRFFHPAQAQWHRSLQERSQQVIDQALKFLCDS